MTEIIKLLLAVVVLTIPTKVMACMPNQSISEQAARQAEYWVRMQDVTGFVYGVVEEEISSNHSNGILRVLHVYRGGPIEGGALEVGERLKMLLVPNTSGCMPPPIVWPPTVHTQPPDTYGVIAIRKSLNDGVRGFYGFIPKRGVELLMAAGIIQSSQIKLMSDNIPPPP